MAHNDLTNWIEKIALEWLKQLENFTVFIDSNTAFVPGGNNGPHMALETPIRNTIHVISALTYLKKRGYSIPNKIDYKLCNWITNNNIFFDRKDTFLARQFGTDFVNGVIGPAWIISGLNDYYLMSKDEKILTILNKTKANIIFDNKSKLWRRYDPFKNKFNIDYTWDHQLFYAASQVNLINIENKDLNNIDLFLNEILSKINFYIRPNGRFHHMAKDHSIQNLILNYLYKRNFQRVEDIENGYHCYILYAFAIIYQKFPNHSLFKNSLFKSSFNFLEKNYDLLVQSKFGRNYNNPSLSLPFIFKVFEPFFSIDYTKILKLVQSSHQEKSDLQGLCISKKDPITSFSRYYELFRYLSE